MIRKFVIGGLLTLCCNAFAHSDDVLWELDNSTSAKTGFTSTTFIVCYAQVPGEPTFAQRMCRWGISNAVTPEKYAQLAGHTKVYRVGRMNRHNTWYWVIEVDKK